MEEIAARYGMALFSIAREKNNIKELQEEAKIVRKILKENEEYISILNSAFLPMENRINLLDESFSTINVDLLSLLKVAVNNGRSNQLIDILLAFNSYCNDYLNVDEGLLFSAKEIDEKTIKEIENKISEIENRHVELILKIDPSLIGGVKVVINGHIYDGSIKHTLEKMKNQLSK